MKKIKKTDILHQKISLPEDVLDLMKRMEEAGEEIYLVGGSLRDFLLGTIPNDYDLATSARPEKTMEVYSDFRVIATGLRHGTVTVLTDERPVEITTFRIDGSYTDARHPDGVTFTKNIREDLSRRDFTVNAMAYHPSVGLVDPFGGQKDLQDRILRTVGEPQLRFSEDALRILRAFRFSAQLGFEIESDTLDGCFHSKSGLTKVAKERISAEFLRLLLSKNPEDSLKAMIQTQVISYVVPNYFPSDRILKTLSQMPVSDTARLGYFLADATQEVATALLKNLKYSNHQITGACAVLRGAVQCISSPAEARRLIASCGIYAEEAILASILLENSPLESYDWVKQSKAPTSISDLAISGRDLMEQGLIGKQIGEALSFLLERVLEEPNLNEKEKLTLLVKTWLEETN